MRAETTELNEREEARTQEAGTDVLHALVFDLLQVRLAGLPRTSLENWAQTAALCVAMLPAARRGWWLDRLASRIFIEFPGYAGGVGGARRDLERCVHTAVYGWQHWCDVHAPRLPLPARGER